MEQITKEELKKASFGQLNRYCAMLREEIVQTVNECGGHLSSNLGTVELTVALHRVFDFPNDKLIFDVGHQCYTHKLLSGRASAFRTLRKMDGLSGFPKRSESEYDCYDTGHAGTALSAALGFSKARDLRGEDFNVIALVGDGSFNNGLVYEALCSIKILKSRVLIILNDNGMSISPTVGGMHEMLEEAKKTGNSVALFERFGVTYRGVINGNDLSALLPALEEAKELLKEGSVLLHVVTRKGQGYPFSESAPVETHGISPSAPERECSSALGEELCALAEQNKRIVAVTAAMTDNLGLRPFFEKFPERAFDVGICEEHASVLCASLAAGGMKPYYAIYSTFLERAFDEIIHDVCAQNLPVTFCIDRAGVSGADGETHQGVFDLSFLSFIPNLTVAIPKDIGELRALLRLSASYPAPLAIRYPREGTEGTVSDIEIGKFEVLHSTMSDITVFAAGERCLRIAEEVREEALRGGMDFTLVNARFLRPLDEELLSSLSSSVFLTLEDNMLCGGLCDAIARYVRRAGLHKTVIGFGYGDAFLPQGSPKELMQRYGPDRGRILETVKKYYAGR